MVNCELFSHVTLLCHRFPEKAHILTHLVNLSFGPKSGFKNKYRARACDFAFGLQHETHLQLRRSVKQK